MDVNHAVTQHVKMVIKRRDNYDDTEYVSLRQTIKSFAHLVTLLYVFVITPTYAITAIILTIIIKVLLLIWLTVPNYDSYLIIILRCADVIYVVFLLLFSVYCVLTCDGEHSSSLF